MKIENPFESGHIKNYILLYASVVVIMVLFFFASTLFQEDKKQIHKKTFATQTASAPTQTQQPHPVEKQKFQLLNSAY
jgi:hypothetical protein